MGQEQSTRGLLMVAVSLAFAAGCQPFPHRGAPLPEAEACRLSASQAADVQVALGRTLEKRGEEEQARAAYAEAVKQDPKRADALVRLAVLSDRQGHFQESEQLYRRALAACPTDADLYCNRGYSLYLQQRWEEAEQSLRQAIALRPDHLRAHNNLGEVLARTGRQAEALEEFHRAGCSPADAHANLALGLMLAGDWPEARQHYERALAANPSAPSARKGLKALTALMQRTQPAPQEVASSRIRQPASSPDPHSRECGSSGTGVNPPGQLPELVQIGHTSPVILAKPVSPTEDSTDQGVPAGASREPAVRGAPQAGPGQWR